MDDDNIEALREILQDMAQTIELISSGARSGNDLIFFLEEMLQTIEAWATKYTVVVDGVKPEVAETVETDFSNERSEQNHNKQEMLLQSPLQEPLPSPENFTTPDQGGKNQERSGGGRGRHSRKKAVAKTPKSRTKSPKTGSTKTRKSSTKSSKARTKSSKSKTKNPKARNITPKTGAKTPKAKASRQRAKASESGDIAGKDAGAGAKADVDADAGAGADQSLTLCIRKEKIVEEMPTPLPASYQPSVRKVEVIESPNWLPHGWITEMKTRGTGSSAGAKDKYFVDPISQRRFRSRREVFAFIQRGNKHGSPRGSSKAEPAMEVEEGSDKSPTEESNEISQEKRTSEIPFNQVGSNTELGTPHLASNTSTQLVSDTSTQLALDTSTQLAVTSSLPTGAIIPPQPGQPSEWLVYENLANLPYPMYEQMRVMENNASKGDPNNATLAPWPWLFGNAEGLKRPFVDNKHDDKKAIISVGENKETEPLAKRPKKTARKSVS